MLDRELLVRELTGAGIFKDREAIRFKPLTGGVSSDIWLLEQGGQRWVVKQALDRLKVQDVWMADVRRNVAEQDFIAYLAAFQPQMVPLMVWQNQEVPYFVMEYLAPPWEPWKTSLLRGDFSTDIAVQAAGLLADLHSHSYRDAAAAQNFNYTPNFYELRVEPYLVTTGKRHPGMQALFEVEAARLMRTREALVHGDFSPKNMMICDSRLVLLDHEVAWYGDPAFDVAFFINHLVLKQIYHAGRRPMPHLALLAWQTYFDQVTYPDLDHLKQRTARLWLLLFLARVDGKSPVEYLSEAQQQFIRTFVTTHLPTTQSTDFEYLMQQLDKELDDSFN